MSARAAVWGRLRALVAGAVLCTAAPAALADIWGYVDDKGVAHFATERLDSRYELFFRGDERFDSDKAQAAAQTPRAVAVPTAASKLIAFFEVSPAYKMVKHHLREAADANGIDYELLQALIATESGFDPRAVSPKGAVGLMQIMPATAERYGVAGDARAPVEQKLTDPRTNIRTGSRYLRDLMRMFPGQLELVLAAYNAGEGAVQRAGNRIPNYRETQNYVATVMQLYTTLKPPAVLAERRAPGRVRMTFNGAAASAPPALPGGAQGRANMVAAPVAPAALPALPASASVAAAPFTIERD